jgi:hypothetical protein
LEGAVHFLRNLFLPDRWALQHLHAFGRYVEKPITPELVFQLAPRQAWRFLER